MNFKYILLTEKSQPEKTAYYMIPIMLISGKGKTINSFFKKNQWLPGIWEWEWDWRAWDAGDLWV